MVRKDRIEDKLAIMLVDGPTTQQPYFNQYQRYSKKIYRRKRNRTSVVLPNELDDLYTILRKVEKRLQE